MLMSILVQGSWKSVLVPGAITILLADLVGPDGHIYSYDIRTDMPLRASENLNGYSPNIKMLRGKSTTSPKISMNTISTELY